MSFAPRILPAIRIWRWLYGLHAGLDGIKNQILPPECMDANMNAMTLEELEANGVEILPRDLGEAIQEFEADPADERGTG